MSDSHIFSKKTSATQANMYFSELQFLRFREAAKVPKKGIFLYLYILN